MIVSDTGAGIDLRRRERLFEPFAAAQSSVAEGSSGLGLSICQRLVQLMNGSLEIDSAPGRGTRVELTVPLHAPAAALGTAPNGDAAVLVCDDDDTSRILLSALLQSAGYRVDETAEAADALRRWREGRVRALITDLHMPNFGGVELIAALRAEEAGRSSRTPVIVCSGSSFTGTEAPFDAALIDGRLVKPVEVSLLVRTLQQLGVHGAPTAQAPVPPAG
jgi:CheY-like chemotaxis protein